MMANKTKVALVTGREQDKELGQQLRPDWLTMDLRWQWQI